MPNTDTKHLVLTLPYLPEQLQPLPLQSSTLAQHGSSYYCKHKDIALVTPNKYAAANSDYSSIVIECTLIPSRITGPVPPSGRISNKYPCGSPRIIGTRAINTGLLFIPPATLTAMTPAQPCAGGPYTWATAANWGPTVILTLAGLWGLRLLTGPKSQSSRLQATCLKVNSSTHRDSTLTQCHSASNATYHRTSKAHTCDFPHPTIKPTAGPPTTPQSCYTIWIKMPQSPSIHITINPMATTVAALKLTISHMCGLPVRLLSPRWQGINLEQNLEDKTLAEIGFMHNDTIRLNMPLKGGMQLNARNLKRTFVLDDTDTDSDEESHCPYTTTHPNSFRRRRFSRQHQRNRKHP